MAAEVYRGPTKPECPDCNGRGVVAQSPGNRGRAGSLSVLCRTCKGLGRLPPEPSSEDS